LAIQLLKVISGGSHGSLFNGIIFPERGIIHVPDSACVFGRHGYYNRALVAIETHPECEPQYVECTLPLTG
jgi:hypothetical protein